MELLDVQHEKASLCQLSRCYSITTYLLFLLFFVNLHEKESRYLCNLRVILHITLFFFTPVTINYKSPWTFFKMVVISAFWKLLGHFCSGLFISFIIYRFSFCHLLSLSQSLIDSKIVLSNIKSIRWALLTGHTFLKLTLLEGQTFVLIL